MEKKELELYIHIPFCVKKCDYCDFLSFSADEQTQRSYVAALQKELVFYGAKYKGRRITTIFIGGGTPSWLREESMQAVMETVYQNFAVDGDAEITIECNPGTITEHKFEVYRRIGINRLSIGLQSVHNEELKILGRIHTFEQFLKTYDMARKHGFSNINIDLMSSLPGQTPEIFCDSLYQVLKLKPEHISAYSLIIEKGTPFYELYRFDAVRQEAGMQTESLPTEEEEYQTTKMTQHILKEAGYHWYEVSNFATVYSADGTHLLVPAVNLHAAAEQTTRNEQMEEFMFLGLRMRDGFYRDEFTQVFGIPIEAVYGDALNHLQQEELLLKREGRIYLTDKGMDLNNYVVAQFML